MPTNDGEEFVVIRLGFVRSVEKDNYGWASVMVPRHAVEDVDWDTPLGTGLGQVLLDHELVEWDEEDDPDFCHSPRVNAVESDDVEEPVCRCWIDDEGNWRVSGEDGSGHDD